MTTEAHSVDTPADSGEGSLRASHAGRSIDVLTGDGATRWHAGERLAHLFEQRVDELDRSGEDSALAVDGPGLRLTYAELDARANQLARFLRRRRGVSCGDRIALLFERPASGYVAMLAALKLNAVFVPLDPGFPAERLSYIAADAGLQVVLCESNLVAIAGPLAAATELLLLDELESQIALESDERLSAQEAGEPGDELCYLIYTSGTTGRPKGVAVGHPSICNFVRVAAESYGVGPEDRVYQGLTLAFDFSFEEIWVAWMAGATLVPKPTARNLLGAELHAFLGEHRVTALCCVPTLLATLDEDLPELRFLLVSGEPCPQALVERWHRPGRRFLNTYGPTEATVSATWTVLHPTRLVTIGVPLPTYSVVILDPDCDRVLPVGALGELGIAGIGLADGYLNRPELTERAFIPDFLSIPDNPSGRIYRTGDLARVNPDGEIEHHGRIDTQVKIRGYRIELGEIEAVLRQAPGVGQAVAGTFEPELGVSELVGYYTQRSDAEPVDTALLYALAQELLPSYMVPAYLQRLGHLPLLPSGKLDRSRLPAPDGPRRLVAGQEYVAPGSAIEATLAGELASVLGVKRVSVTADFFDQLGANSLLMARFNARLRDRRGELPAVSMKDVYLHPTVRRLAMVLNDRADADGEPASAVPEEPRLPPTRGRPHHRLCGALQLLAFFAYVSASAFAFDRGATWLAAAHGVLALYARSLVVGAGLLVGTGALPVVAKWVLIGRFKPERVRAWSLPYLRFWIVKTLIVSNPVAHLLVGSPLYPVYLRALGARIGRRVLILTHHIPVCTDLLSIGEDSVINKNAYLNGYRARAGSIEIAAVRIGTRAYVGERSVLDIGTAIGDGGELAYSSSLAAGQAVPAEQCWHGSPAEQAPPGTEYRPVLPSGDGGRLRAIVHSAARIAVVAALAGPAEVAIGVLLFTHPRFLAQLPAGASLIVAAGLLGCLLLANLLIALTVPRVLTRLFQPGRAYALYGFHYSLLRIIALSSNNPLLTGLFGDSVMIPHYLRALGWHFGALEQTGSNFGLDVKQELPGLSYLGTGTMVSDGLSMMNAEFSSRSFRVLPVRIGKRNFLGNAICCPAGGRTGDNCLLATKVLIPVSGPIRSDVGLLGSPCFEIPRSVRRDSRFEGLAGGAERERRLAAKTRHNLVTMALHLLESYVLLVGLVLIALAPLGGSGLRESAGTVATAFLELAVAVAWFVLVERAVTGFKPLRPRFCSIYEIDFWRHERYWKVARTGYAHIFDGTPFKPFLWRALGVPVSRRVFDDGLAIVERTLVSIGGETTFNMGSNLQSHTLEDGRFKSEPITIGSRCTLGTGALVNYGATMEDGAVLEADSFLMKGSRVAADARWRGNPATEICNQGGAT